MRWVICICLAWFMISAADTARYSGNVLTTVGMLAALMMSLFGLAALIFGWGI